MQAIWQAWFCRLPEHPPIKHFPRRARTSIPRRSRGLCHGSHSVTSFDFIEFAEEGFNIPDVFTFQSKENTFNSALKSATGLYASFPVIRVHFGLSPNSLSLTYWETVRRGANHGFGQNVKPTRSHLVELLHRFLGSVPTAVCGLLAFSGGLSGTLERRYTRSRR